MNLILAHYQALALIVRYKCRHTRREAGIQDSRAFEGKRLTRYSATCHARAIDEWVKMKRVETGYETQFVDGIRYIARWPKQAMEDFVLEAFGDNIISADS